MTEDKSPTELTLSVDDAAATSADEPVHPTAALGTPLPLTLA
jgi:hypothetical protein